MENIKEAMIDEILRIREDREISVLQQKNDDLLRKQEEITAQIKKLEETIAQTREKIKNQAPNLAQLSFVRLGEILDKLHGEETPSPEKEASKFIEEEKPEPIEEEKPEPVKEEKKPVKEEKPEPIEEVEPEPTKEEIYTKLGKLLKKLAAKDPEQFKKAKNFIAKKLISAGIAHAKDLPKETMSIVIEKFGGE